MEPAQQLEKLRVEGGLATRKLEDFDFAFSVDDALNSAL
jgi:hypothetical protein